MSKGIYVLITNTVTAEERLASFFDMLMNIVEKSSQSSEDRLLIGGAMMSIATLLYHDELGNADGNTLFDNNAVDFIKLIERETGLSLEIIAPEEEARLAVISCAPLVSINTEQLLVVDIGGGSTELIWIDLSKVPKLDRRKSIMRLHSGFKVFDAGVEQAEVIDWISVPLG